MKKSIILLVALILVGLAVVLMVRSCQDSGRTSTSFNVDSLITAHEREKRVYHQYIDSADRALDAQDQAILALKVAKDQAESEARKSREKAVYWALQYRKAKQQLDTAGQLAACDSLATEFEAYIGRADQFISYTDSVINAQHAMIQSQGQVIDRQREHIAKQDTAVSFLQKVNTDLVAENTALKKDVARKKRQGNGKGILAFVLGAVLGFIVK